MYVVGLDDTDSREAGMCTTYVGTVLAERLREAGLEVRRQLLVRCNPAVEHKTRGNAAVALHVDAAGAAAASDAGVHAAANPAPDADTDADDGTIGDLAAAARAVVDEFAATDDPRTNPGVVVAPSLDRLEDDTADELADFSRRTVRDHHDVSDAVALADRAGFRTAAWGNGRGRIGALAAVGAWHARESWTYERIAYRESSRWGTERDVDVASVRAAADEYYPTVWDTVDRTAKEAVCVPHTPGPVLYGIRGDERDAVESVAASVDAEPVARAATFVTNQGTDAHVRPEPADSLSDGAAYRVDGVVASEPETRRGGHVFLGLARSNLDGPDASEFDDASAVADGSWAHSAAQRAEDRAAEGDADADDRDTEPGAELGVGRDVHGERREPRTDLESTLECVAFEPTKRFRDRVRALRRGDAVTVVGEVADGTLKLEKFALRDPVRTERTTPECPTCGRHMESAGAEAGYRCRDCGTSTDGAARRPLERDLEVGWYEVPPRARRHVAKPLVRGGFDASVHPER